MRKRPGRKPAFTRRQVIDATLAEGIGSFTLRAVAERLGVKATALYREFSSRQELQLAAISAIAADIEPDPQLCTWQDVLRDVVDRQWQMCVRYPEAAAVIVTRPEAFGVALPRITAMLRGWPHSVSPGARKGQPSPWTSRGTRPWRRTCRSSRT